MYKLFQKEPISEAIEVKISPGMEKERLVEEGQSEASAVVPSTLTNTEDTEVMDRDEHIQSKVNLNERNVEVLKISPDETFGDELSLSILNFREELEARVFGLDRTGREERVRDAGDMTLEANAGQREEGDLASVIQEATNSKYLDFGIGLVFSVIVGIFCRRLFLIYPNLGFGLL